MVDGEQLLKEIARDGWTERLARRFEKEHGDGLRWLIVVNMNKFGLLHTKTAPNKVKDVLADRKLELYQNTYSDLWEKLLDGLIDTYLKRKNEGKVHTRFIYYAGGTIKHLIVSNAKDLNIFSKTSPTELIRGICNRKKEKTVKAKIALAKFRLGFKVTNGLLSRCPDDLFEQISPNRHHLADYFFEEYVLESCEWITDQRGNLVSQLLDRFGNADFRSAVEFIGEVTPYGLLDRTKLDVPEGMTAEEYLDTLENREGEGWL